MMFVQILWFEKGEKHFRGLQPPRAIAQSAALASCYARSPWGCSLVSCAFL